MSRPKIVSDSEILDISFRVISMEGFDSFTLQQVSKATHLSPSTLLKRFKSKKNLALLARNRKWDKNLSQMDEASILELSGLKGIFDFLYLIAGSVDSKRLGEHLKFLGNEATTPRLRKDVALYFDRTRKIFRRLLEEAVQRKELSPDLDPTDFSLTLEALVQGSIFQFAFLDERDIGAHLKRRIESALKPFVHQR